MQNRESIKKLIPILQAYADGKTIERNDCGTWREIELLDLNNQFVEYRVRANDDHSIFKEDAVEEDDDFTVTEQEEALDELENLRDKLDDIIDKLKK
jgi:hypothetical protein